MSPAGTKISTFNPPFPVTRCLSLNQRLHERQRSKVRGLRAAGTARVWEAVWGVRTALSADWDPHNLKVAERLTHVRDKLRTSLWSKIYGLKICGINLLSPSVQTSKRELSIPPMLPRWYWTFTFIVLFEAKRDKPRPGAVDVFLRCFWPYQVWSWPWPLTFWPQNLMSSSLLPDAAKQIWWNFPKRVMKYRVCKDAQTDGCTDNPKI